MRATSMRRLVGGAAAGLLIAATFLGTTAPAFAAVPTGSATNEAIPAQFSAGSNVGFRTSFDEQDTSSLSKLYLVLNVTGASSNFYVSATLNGGTVAKACTLGIPVTCTFKTVRPGDHVVVTAGFSVAANTTTVTGDGIWSTSGASTRDGGGTSHGDTWADPNGAAASTFSSDVNFGGGFSVSNGTEIANGQAVSTLNRQATKLLGLPAGVAATVLDGSTSTGDCGTIDCSSAFGEWSEVTVGDGQTFGSPFQIVITYYQGKPAGFVHRYGSAPNYSYELVGPCPKKNPAGAAPCFTWDARTSQATILTFHNGSWRGL
jgi:hypothetical protein